MEEKQTGVRKTVLLDEDLVQQCERLYGAAGVKNFSQFVKQALTQYTQILVMENYQDLLSKEVQTGIAKELEPIKTRLSKSLYRYAVELDMLCQILGYYIGDYSEVNMEYIRRAANVRVAKTRGFVDVGKLLKEEVNDNDYGDDW